MDAPRSFRHLASFFLFAASHDSSESLQAAVVSKWHLGRICFLCCIVSLAVECSLLVAQIRAATWASWQLSACSSSSWTACCCCSCSNSLAESYGPPCAIARKCATASGVGGSLASTGTSCITCSRRSEMLERYLSGSGVCSFSAGLLNLNKIDFEFL
jgi:hypothetical protein